MPKRVNKDLFEKTDKEEFIQYIVKSNNFATRTSTEYMITSLYIKLETRDLLKKDPHIIALSKVYPCESIVGL
jgi:hypothetical protein